MEEKYTERLAKYVIIISVVAVIAALSWFFREVLAYVIIAALVTLLSKPLYNFIVKLKIRKHYCPNWLAAVLSILLVLGILLCIVTTVIPLVRNVSRDISDANINELAQSVTVPLKNLNEWIIHTIPKVGKDFKIESVVLGEVQKMVDISTLSDVVGSVTSFFTKIGVGIFSVIFISFFFIKSPGLVTSIITAFVPDRMERKVRKSLDEIGVLLSRYFIGLLLEVLGVALVNFILLLSVARMGFKYSIGIAFITGVLNIVPYIGPLIGYIFGVGLCVIIKYACVPSFGLGVGFIPFVLIVLGIMLFAQLIDNVVFQPVIYSNSVQVHPLEIFIVFLLAGHVGGMVGMLCAIPSYTVLRVIAKQFLSDIKPIRMLTSDKE